MLLLTNSHKHTFIPLLSILFLISLLLVPVLSSTTTTDSTEATKDNSFEDVINSITATGINVDHGATEAAEEKSLDEPLLNFTTSTDQTNSKTTGFFSKINALIKGGMFCDSEEEDVFQELKTEAELDPGSWRPIFEPEVFFSGDKSVEAGESEYYWGVLKMVTAVSSGEQRMMEEATAELEAVAKAGNPHAQSVMGFLYGLGQMREKNRLKSFMYHYLAAKGGNSQSKMALAYMYLKQQKHDEALALYIELANLTLHSFLMKKHLPLVLPTPLKDGTEENKDLLRKFRGEEDEEFEILKSLAEKGNGAAMHTVGLYYYMGLRGVRRDWDKAMFWFSKAAQKEEPKAMEVLGEMYAKGDGVERNYTKAFECFQFAAEKQVYSAYNGLGYLYATGYGAEKNYTKARECFNWAANLDGDYYLAQMYQNGIGVNKSTIIGAMFFSLSAASLQPRAIYKMAQTYHSNCSALPKDIAKAIELYKYIAEQGPWSALSRWAMKAYIEGDMGKAFFLFSRLAELGYEVAQSNAMWILEKHDGDTAICFGESGHCTDAERLQRAHSLWLPHSI